MAPTYHALSADGARVNGGRWNPPESYPVLYTSTSREAAVQEAMRAAQKRGVPPTRLLPRKLVTYEARLQRVLDFTQADSLAALGLTTSSIVADDMQVTRAIGEAAHYVGFEAILAPSAALTGHSSLSIFMSQLLVASGSRLDPVDETVAFTPSEFER